MQGMQKSKLIMIMAGCLFSWAQANAATTPVATEDASAPVKENIKYRSGTAMNFDEMLIQGQLKRPELNVVVGNAAENTDGLLRLRENFNDQTQIDIGEELQ